MTYKFLSVCVLILAPYLWAEGLSAVRLKQGQTLESKGEYAKALDEYRAVLVDDPDNARAYLGAGNARYQLKGYNAALKNYQLAARKDPRLWDAYEGMATSYEALGQKEKAIAEWRRLIDQGPQERRAKALNRIESLLGKEASAARAVQASPAVASPALSSAAPPGNSAADKFNYDGPLFQKALAQYQAGKYKESLDWWRKVLDAQPGNPGAYYYAGVSRYNLGEWDKAVYNLQRSVNYPDRGFNAYYYLGRIAERQKNIPKIREYYGKYLQAPASAEGKAEVRKRLASYDDASAGTEKNAEKTQSCPEPLPSRESCNLAEARRVKDSVAAALKALEPKPLTVGPEKNVTLESGQTFVFASSSEAGGADLQKALNLIQGKSFNQAIDALKAVRQQYPNTPNAAAAAYNLAGLFRYLGLGENALTTARAALQENPPDPYRSALAYQLAQGLNDQGDYAAAYTALDSVQADKALGPTAGQKLALASEISRKYKPGKDAIGLLRRAVENESDPVRKAERRLELADALISQNEAKEASQVYSEMLDSCQNATMKHCRTAIYALGDMSYKAKNWPMALEHYQKAVDRFSDQENAPWALYQIANVYRQQKRWTEAVKAYDRLLKEFPGSYWADQAKWNREDVIWQEKNQQILGRN